MLFGSVGGKFVELILVDCDEDTVNGNIKVSMNINVLRHASAPYTRLPGTAQEVPGCQRKKKSLDISVSKGRL